MTENHKDSGSFVTGFMFGIAAGAVGYFAFGTKQGTQLRHRLQEEWQVAREQLSSGASDGDAIPVAHNIFSQVKQLFKDSLASLDHLVVTDQSDKKSAKKKRAKTSKFKNI